MAAETITITIKADDDASATLKKLRDEIDNVGKAGKGAGKGIGGAPGKKGGGLGSALGGLMLSAGPYGAAAAAIGGALVGIGKASIGAAAEMEKLTSQMAAALPATESADARMAELVKTSKEMVGLDLKNMVKFDTQLRSVGLNSKQIDTTIQAVTKSMAAQGKSTADTTRVLDQLQQAFASGSIKAEDMKTVFREMPGFQNAVKTAFGENVTSIDKFRDAAAAAGLTAEQALMSALTELDKASEGASLDTYAAQTEMLGENFSQLGANIGKAVLPAITWLVKGLNSLLDSLPAAWEWVKNFFVKTLPDLFARFADWSKSIDLKVAGFILKIKDFFVGIINNIIGIIDKVTGVFGVSIKELIADIPIIGQLLSKEQQAAEQAWLKKEEEKLEARRKNREQAKADEAAAKKEAADAIAREEEKQKQIAATAEAFRVAARDKRIEYLNTMKGIEKTNFDERRTLVNDYYNALEQSIKNSQLTEEQKGKELKQATVNRTAALKVIKTDEVNHAIAELDRQIEETKNANDALSADENTTREEMKTAVNAYYDLEEQRARLKIKEQTALDTELTKIRGDRDEKIRKVDADYDKRDAQRKAEELKRQQALDKQLATALTARADKAKRELETVVSDTTSSLDSRKTANDTYYAHLTAQMLQREKDTSKHQGILEDMTKQRLASEQTLTTNYYDALVNKQELSLRAMAVSDDASFEDRKASTEALFALKEQKLRAEKHETQVLNDKLTLLAHEKNSALKAIDDEETARDDTKTQKKIQNIDDLIAKQELAMQVLNQNETASVDARIAEVERLHALKVQKLFAEERDAEVRKDKLILLEQETADEIAAINDEKTEKEKGQRLDSIADAEAALADILAAEESTADEINAAAQRVHDEKTQYVEDYVKEEEDAAEMLEGIQADLDAARTSSIEMFWERHGELVQQGLDLALQAAETEINLMKGVRDAERRIQQDRARARVEFDAEWQSIVQGYTAEIELARAQAIPLIKEAFDRGDKEEANRLQAELDKIIGMTSDGQVLLDEHGNQMGLIAKRTAELDKITQDINDAELDFFAEIRDIQNEAKQQRAKAWWEVGGQLVGTVLGAGASALSGGAIPADMAMKVGGDLGKFVGSELGDIHAGRIEDTHLRRELQIYQQQQQRKAQNRAAGILSSSDLSDALKGTDFDPAVIAQRELDAQAAIQKRLKELHQEKIEDVKWTMEQEKRAFDQLRATTDASLTDLTARYDVYYESQKTLATLEAKDQEDLNRRLRRLWWSRVDTLDAVKDALAKDDDDADDVSTSTGTGASARDTAPARDSGSAAATPSKRDYLDDLRWDVENAKYYLEQGIANEKATLETLQGLHETYWANRRKVINASDRTQKQKDRDIIRWERLKLAALDKLNEDYHAAVERRRAQKLREDTADATTDTGTEETAEPKELTPEEQRRKAIADLRWQIETASYLFRKQQQDENATLEELGKAHTALYQLKMELSALEGAATGDAIEQQRRLIRLQREQSDALAALTERIKARDAAKVDPDAEKAEAKRLTAISDLKWDIETAGHLLNQLRQNETATVAELQAQLNAFYAHKRALIELEVEEATAKSRALTRLEREQAAAQADLNKRTEADKAETRQKDIADLRWQIETANYLLQQLKAKETVTLEELQAQHTALYTHKRALVELEIADAAEKARALTRLDRESQAAFAGLQASVPDAQETERLKSIADLKWEIETAGHLLEQLRARETATVAELLAQHNALYQHKRELIELTLENETERARELVRLEREQAAALTVIQQRTETEKETTRQEDIASLKWQVESAAYLLEQLHKKEKVTLAELHAQHHALWDYKQALTELEITDSTKKSRELVRLERERTAAMTQLNDAWTASTDATAAKTQQTRIKTLQWEIENTAYLLAQRKLQEGITLEELQAGHRALWDFKKQLIELEVEETADKARALIRLDRQRTAALTTIETDYLAAQQREKDKQRAKAAGQRADEKAETLDDLQWEIETTTYYLNRMKSETFRTYQEIAAQQTLLFNLRVKHAELTETNEEDRTRAITRLEREHADTLEALQKSIAERKQREREAELADRQAQEREARETAEQEARQAGETQGQIQGDIADTARETTDTVIQTTREQVESQTDASTKMMRSMAASARESGSAIQSVAQTMQALGASLKEQTRATVDAMSDIADETIGAIYELLDATEETAAQRVTTETDADAEILASKATTNTAIQTGVGNLYTANTAAGETWKTNFEEQLASIVTATATQTAVAQTHFDGFYTGITEKHNAFGLHFVQSLAFASELIDITLGVWQEDYGQYYDARHTELDGYLDAFAQSLGTQLLLTEAVTDGIETEYQHLYASLSHQAQAYAEFQGSLVDDLSSDLAYIHTQLQYAESRARALGDIDRDRNRVRDTRSRELFHSAEMDAIAASGGRATAERIKRENASDFTHFFSKEFLEAWGNVNGTPPGGARTEQPVALQVYLNFDDGTTQKLYEQIVDLQEQGRLNQ